jgi:hypothetical protein
MTELLAWLEATLEALSITPHETVANISGTFAEIVVTLSPDDLDRLYDDLSQARRGIGSIARAIGEDQGVTTRIFFESA